MFLQSDDVLDVPHKIKIVYLLLQALSAILVLLSLIDLFSFVNVWNKQGLAAIQDVDIVEPLIKTITFVSPRNCNFPNCTEDCS